MKIIDQTNISSGIQPIVDGYVKELACIDEKIQYLMRKVLSANQDLHQVNTELKKLGCSAFSKFRSGSFQYVDGGVLSRIRNSLKDKFRGLKNTGLSNKHEIESLLSKKAALEEFREVNHNALSHYEQALAKCEQAFMMFKESNNFLLEPIDEVKIQEPGLNQGNGLLVGYSYGITLGQFMPYGIGADPTVIDAQARAQKLFEKAMSCRKIKDLYIEAMLTSNPLTGEIGPWVLYLMNEKACLPEIKEFGAGCNMESRIIEVDERHTDDEVLATFVFELTNAVSSQSFHELIVAAQQGNIDRETYAKETERIEHEGTLRHRRIMSSAIKTMGWDRSMDIFRRLKTSFDEHWPYIKNSPHTEFYREQWDLIAKMRMENRP